MSAGIRATVEFPSGEVCPIARLSAATDERVDAKAATVSPDEGTGDVSEFALDADVEVDDAFTPVFSDGSTSRYRLDHDGAASCPCEWLGRFGCPVDRYVAEEGTLTVVFHAAGYDELQAVVGELREQFPTADIKRFVRSPTTAEAADSVYVDRSKLTDKQLESLETAYRMGYFDRPRGANATEVAAALDIDPSTLSEHLAAAQSKLLDDVL